MTAGRDPRFFLAYLTVLQFRTRTIMPGEDVDQIQALYPGFLDSKLAEYSSLLDSRLRKRYQAPFASPAPEIVLSWLTRLVTLDAYLRRGFNPASEQDSLIVQAAKDAKEELREAADSKEGLFDLPVREDLQASAVTSGGPLFYAEQSPYTWTTLQLRDGSSEDSST